MGFGEVFLDNQSPHHLFAAKNIHRVLMLMVFFHIVLLGIEINISATSNELVSIPLWPLGWIGNQPIPDPGRLSLRGPNRRPVVSRHARRRARPTEAFLKHPLESALASSLLRLMLVSLQHCKPKHNYSKFATVRRFEPRLYDSNWQADICKHRSYR